MSIDTLGATMNELFKSFPVCVVPCFDTQELGKCKAVDDLGCLCHDIYWMTGNLVCIGQTCNATEITKFESLFVQWCNISFILASEVASSSALAAEATSSATLIVKSIKPKSLVGILIGSIAGSFLVILTIVFLLRMQLHAVRMKRQRPNWEVDLAQPKDLDDNTSEHSTPVNPSTPYLLPEPTSTSISPVHSQPSHTLGGSPSKHTTTIPNSGDDTRSMEEVGVRRFQESLRWPAPSEARPPSYRSQAGPLACSTCQGDAIAVPPVPPGLTAILGDSFLVL